jgi:hypothetical protein
MIMAHDKVRSDSAPPHLVCGWPSATLPAFIARLNSHLSIGFEFHDVFNAISKAKIKQVATRRFGKAAAPVTCVKRPPASPIL